jgi:hypothetical protein
VERDDEAQRDFATTNAMLRMGGSFVKALAMAARAADPTNLAKLKAAFPDYFEKYAELGKRVNGGV